MYGCDVCEWNATSITRKLFYRTAQFIKSREAKLARDILAAIGTPSKADLKKIISMNAISNLPVQASDVDLAEKIYGPDIGTLKGKTTRKFPLPMETDIIELPPEITEDRSSWELCMDVMFVNGMPFLTSGNCSIGQHNSSSPERPSIYMLPWMMYFAYTTTMVSP